MAACTSYSVRLAAALDTYSGVVDNGGGLALTLTDVAESGVSSGLHSLKSGWARADSYCRPAVSLTGQRQHELVRLRHAHRHRRDNYTAEQPNPIATSMIGPAPVVAVNKLGTICALPILHYIWDRLTYMWSNVSVTTDADRSALQFATWLGAADQWDGLPGANFNYNGLDAGVLAQAQR